MSITTTNNIMEKNLTDKYWKKNLKYLVILLSIWFTVSFGFGILLIDGAGIGLIVLFACINWTVLITQRKIKFVKPKIWRL